MPHDLCMDADGNAEMMYVGQMPWHGLGAKLTQAPTAAEAIRAARLDWRVTKKQLFVGEEHRPLADNTRLCARTGGLGMKMASSGRWGRRTRGSRMPMRLDSSIRS